MPALVRNLVPSPIAELRSEPFSEYVHGTLFFTDSRDFILAQVLNTIELATGGEARPLPQVTLRLDSRRVRVVGARMVWPELRDLEIRHSGNYTTITLTNLERYAALYLRVV